MEIFYSWLRLWSGGYEAMTNDSEMEACAPFRHMESGKRQIIRLSLLTKLNPA